MTVEYLSIKERIGRTAVRLVQAMIALYGGTGKVYRFDGRGLRDPATGLGADADGARISMQPGDAFVAEGDETAEEGGQGNPGYTLKKLTLQVAVQSVLDETDPTPEATLHNRWLMRMEKAVLKGADGNGHYFMDELGTGHGEERLAIDTRVTRTFEPPRETGQPEVDSIIEFEVQYQHEFDDPARGAGIRARVDAILTSAVDVGDLSGRVDLVFSQEIAAADFALSSILIDDHEELLPALAIAQLNATTLRVTFDLGGGALSSYEISFASDAPLANVTQTKIIP